MGRHKGGDNLAENMSCVAVAHLHEGDASALHRIAQLPFVLGHLKSDRHQTYPQIECASCPIRCQISLLHTRRNQH